MRKAAYLAIPLLLGGCSGFGQFVHDTASLPGSNPNRPEGHSENIEKILGHDYIAMPILPEHSDIWPGAPQPLPTLRDVEGSPNGLRDALSDTSSYFGKMAAGDGQGNMFGPQLRDGEKLDIGEHHDTTNGVGLGLRPSLSSSVHDNAGKYLGAGRTGAIVIQNGDGTSTTISPDGTVLTSKDQTSH